MKPITAEVELDVQFYDLDPMNIVWHGNYARYFEVARCEVLAKIGFGYTEMKNSGFSWPIIELKTRYIKPARLGQKLICEASITEFENRLKIDYLITCAATGKKMTRGHSIQVAVDAVTEDMQLVSPGVLIDKIRAVHEKA